MTDLVVVVTPMYKPDLSREEEMSLQQLRKVLGRWPHYAVAPDGHPGLKELDRVKHFAPAWFSGIESYSRLLLTGQFYEAFRDYEYMLIYQLDCLVFSDSLEEWCDRGWDYIAAPWLKNAAHPAEGFSRVGNGGLSLRRVKSFADVIESEDVPTIWSVLQAPLGEGAGDMQSDGAMRRARLWRDARRGSAWYREHYTLNEDRFWSDRARLFKKDFRVAPVSEGLQFAFEKAPRYCLERNGGRLPFGCHAWARYDRAFWEPFLQ